MSKKIFGGILHDGKVLNVVGVKGEKGEKGQDGVIGPVGPQGPQGASFTYNDFTEDQLEALKGQDGTEIESITKISESSEDGGMNRYSVNLSNGQSYIIETKNGTKGSQGDSAVYDPSSPDTPDFEMANTTGQSTTKAMTQKAVTEGFEKNLTDIDALAWEEQVPSGGLDRYYLPVSSGQVTVTYTNANSLRLCWWKVQAGEVWKIRCTGTGATTSGYVDYAIFEDVPEANSTSSNYAAYTGNTDIEIEIQSDGYLAIANKSIVICKKKVIKQISSLTIDSWETQTEYYKLKGWYLRQYQSDGYATIFYQNGGTYLYWYEVHEGETWLLRTNEATPNDHIEYAFVNTFTENPTSGTRLPCMKWSSGQTNIEIHISSDGYILVSVASGHVAEAKKKISEDITEKINGVAENVAYEIAVEKLSEIGAIRYVTQVPDGTIDKYTMRDWGTYCSWYYFPSSATANTKYWRVNAGEKWMVRCEGAAQNSNINHATYALFTEVPVANNGTYITNYIPYSADTNIVVDVLEDGYLAVSRQGTPICKKQEVDTIEDIAREVVDTSIDNDEEEMLIKYSTSLAPSSTSTPYLSLLHYSDIHISDIAAAKINELIDTYSDYIDDIINTGDVVYGTINESAGGYTWWLNSSLVDKSLLTLGNHDDCTSIQNLTHETKEWSHNTYYAPYISQLGYIMPNGYDDSSLPNYQACYWHKDYAEQRIRLIGLDGQHKFDGHVNSATGEILHNGSGNTTPEQERWLIEKLAETLPGSGSSAEGYAVIACGHYPLDDFAGDNKEWDDTTHEWIYNQKSNGGRVIDNKTNNVVNFHRYNNTSWTANNRYRWETAYGFNNFGDIIQHYMEQEGSNFICFLSGHTHNNHFFYPTRYPNILDIGIDMAGNKRDMWYANQGTMGGCVANLVSVHASGIIRIVRLGVKSDTFLTPIHYIYYNTKTRTVVSEG